MLVKSTPMMFIAASHVDEAKKFYANILGLNLLEDTPFALVFDLQGIMLRVQKVETFTPAPYTVLGWEVDDLVTTLHQLAQLGVHTEHFAGIPQDDLGIWTSSNGDKIAWFRDPDGNVLSLTQFPN